jgi:PAS domain S-box-containing protein
MKRKIVLFLFVLFMLFSSGALMSIFYIRNITEEFIHLITLHQIENFRRSLVISIQNVQSDLYTIHTSFGHKLDFIVDNVANLENTAQRCVSCHHQPTISKRIQTIQSLIQEYKTSLSRYITISANAEMIENLELETATIGNKILLSTESMSSAASEKLGVLTGNTIAKMNYVKTSIFITLIFAFLFGLVISINLTRSITKPIKQLVNATRIVASGSLGHTIAYKDKTEFGELARNFNRMSVALKEGYDHLGSANQELHREITERRWAEAALREAEEQYRTLVENVQDAIVVLQHGKAVYRNPAYETLLGFTVQDTAERSFLEVVVPQDRDRVREYYSNRLRGEVVPDQYEVGLLTRDGLRVPVEVRPCVIQYQGQPAILVVMRDITERKQADEERRSIEVQLRQAQKIEAIGTLAGGIAHDFNNILAAIIGYTELATCDTSRASPVWQHLQEVLTAGKRAKSLVQQILMFSRQSEHEREPVQIPLLVQEVLILLRASLPTTIEIRQHIDTQAGAVLADPTRMHQLLLNLCTNAEHAMRQRGGILEVRVDAVEVEAALASHHGELQPGWHVLITIRDTGHGMGPEVLERIFEPFFTTKGVGEGTGMGLAMVHGIVISHGGALTVQSATGTGTTFEIYLPRIDQTTEETTRSEVSIPHGKGCILFVDDEGALARLGQEMLEQLGYDVVARISSIEALEAFRAMPQRFDVVITDQTMPHMTGEALTRELRRIRPDIPIILCTGFSHVMNTEKAHALGIDAFCMKPLSTQDLGLTIQQVLAQRSEQIPQTGARILL